MYGLVRAINGSDKSLLTIARIYLINKPGSVHALPASNAPLVVTSRPITSLEAEAISMDTSTFGALTVTVK